MRSRVTRLMAAFCLLVLTGLADPAATSERISTLRLDIGSHAQIVRDVDGIPHVLRTLQTAVGLIPNLAATMAESPALLRGFLALRELHATTGFSAGEVQVLSLTAAYENDCAWCVAFHTAMALKAGVDRDAVDALRQGGAPTDPRLGPLSNFARAMVRNRGGIDPPALQAFFAAGYSKRQALDVVMGMAFSLMANYASHLTQPPLDDFLTPHSWTR